MSEKATIPVLFQELADNERLIFKLIFSVSERSRNRSHQYYLADENHTGPCLVVTGSDAPCDEKSQRLVIRVCDRNSTSEEPSIERPLIATRVLTALDTLVEKFGVLQEVKENKEAQTSAAENKDELSQTGKGETQDQEGGEFVEFSISEEEASELAIVHDDTLANPANRDDQQSQDEEIATDVPSAVTELPQEETVTDREVISSSHLNEEKIQTALVVDDSASVRKQLEIELELFEVTVDYAEDAERAIDLLQQKNYDVAFLDVVLPDQDGFSICKKIKAGKESKSTKVVMLTGKASHADKVRGSLAGCDAYLVKPVGRVTFQSTVKKFLKPVENIQVMEA